MASPAAAATPAPLRVLLSSQSDRRLLRLVGHGHEGCFDELVRRHRPGMVSYAGQIVGAHEAEDVVQQALLNAYRALANRQQVEKPKAWLYRITHNEALRTLERRRDIPGLSGDLLEPPIPGLDPQAILEQRERLRFVFSAVQALPERQRSALLLREMEGLSYEEIAEALGESQPVVRQLLSRARTKLRDGVGCLVPLPLVGMFARTKAASAAGFSLGAATSTPATGVSGAILAKAGVVVVVGAAAVAGNQAISSPAAPQQPVAVSQPVAQTAPRLPAGQRAIPTHPVAGRSRSRPASAAKPSDEPAARQQVKRPPAVPRPEERKPSGRPVLASPPARQPEQRPASEPASAPREFTLTGEMTSHDNSSGIFVIRIPRGLVRLHAEPAAVAALDGCRVVRATIAGSSGEHPAAQSGGSPPPPIEARDLSCIQRAPASAPAPQRQPEPAPSSQPATRPQPSPEPKAGAPRVSGEVISVGERSVRIKVAESSVPNQAGPGSELTLLLNPRTVLRVADNDGDGQTDVADFSPGMRVASSFQSAAYGQASQVFGISELSSAGAPAPTS